VVPVKRNPVTELDARFSSEDASPTPWKEARQRLVDAEVSWLSTVRPDGRPHVTTLLSVWLDDAGYFCTGPAEQKAKNLEMNRHCVLTTGCNEMRDGFDVVVEGDAVRVHDSAQLRRIADEYESKYGPEWRFEVRDDVFVQDEVPDGALVFRVAPATAFGFGRGKTYSQTRYRFGE
jgi:nitroimidazol reductase NimA-like FMN-containing flavoprotein (pyridoxamine 5'-phosphate oxidase superfamily)